MKHTLLTALVALITFTAAGGLHAQVAGTTTLAVAQLDVVASGWSAKRQVLGKPVYNEDGDRVGKIDDLVIAPDTSVSFVIIGAEGFVGLKRHHVAIPVDQLSEQAGHFVLPGATKAAIKALPSFAYAQ
jgi:sporulation protein YlmC with PRC-barrel domain